MWDWMNSIFMKFRDTIYSRSELIHASIGGFFIYYAVTNCDLIEPDMNKVIIAGLSPGAIMINQRSRENMGLTKERGRWEIIEDMLIVLTDEKKSKKTRIMQKAYLDWRNFQRYFDFLLEEGFISKYNGPLGEGYYEMTEKGKELLKRLRNVKDILH